MKKTTRRASPLVALLAFVAAIQHAESLNVRSMLGIRPLPSSSIMTPGSGEKNLFGRSPLIKPAAVPKPSDLRKRILCQAISPENDELFRNICFGGTAAALLKELYDRSKKEAAADDSGEDSLAPAALEIEVADEPIEATPPPKKETVSPPPIESPPKKEPVTSIAVASETTKE